jgi:hypothetical protein
MAIEVGRPLSPGAVYQRLLSLEIRSSKIGFAVIEEGADLIDWGVRVFPCDATGADKAIRILAFLLQIYAPTIVTARRARRVKHPSSEKAAYLFRKTQTELKRRSVRFIGVDRRDVSRFFRGQDCSAKHEIEAYVAEKFAEVKQKLPGRRRLWDKEPYVVPAFDALATALAFSAQEEVAS